jgi:hypothetical protein
MPHEPMPPEPIDGRRTATEPTGDPRCAPPAATHRHHAPDATHLLFLRAASRMPHEPKPPEPIDGRRTAMEPTDDLAHAPPTTPPAATHRARAAHHTARRHAPSPRPRRDPHVHPRQDETSPVSEHTAALRVLRTSRRLTLGHQTAEPIHWCTRLHPSPHPAPALCSTRVPALGRDARHASPACSLSAWPSVEGLRPSKTRMRYCYTPSRRPSAASEVLTPLALTCSNCVRTLGDGRADPTCDRNPYPNSDGDAHSRLLRSTVHWPDLSSF